jgi:hypothetical protein
LGSGRESISSACTRSWSGRPLLSWVSTTAPARWSEAGTIGEDMFRELCFADIVVADVSTHDASVFYELGVRHALRPRSTVLISAGNDEIPFDPGADRYLRYDVVVRP